MRILCMSLLCLLLCGCLGVANTPQQPQPLQTTIEIQEVQRADFSDKEPKRAFSWVFTICMAGSLFLVPMIMLKGTRL